MSYAIIKKIQIRDNKVYVTCASNNVFPRTPREHESGFLNKILHEKGKEAVDISILDAYQSGNFQGGSNKYTRALKVLRHMPEYKEFDWRQDNYSTYTSNMETRKEEFNSILLKALKTQPPKEKYIVSKKHHEEDVFMKYRKNSSVCQWTRERERATVFPYKADAESIKKCFTYSDNWQVLTLTK